MKTFEMQVCVSSERVVTLRLPDDVLPGDHRIVLVIDESAVSAPARPALSNPEGVLAGLGIKLTLEDFEANRREMWGGSTDREADHFGGFGNETRSEVQRHPAGGGDDSRYARSNDRRDRALLRPPADYRGP
jgi:hypothetical protein